MCLFVTGNGGGSESTRYPLSVVLRTAGGGAVSLFVPPVEARNSAHTSARDIVVGDRDSTSVGTQIVAVGGELDAVLFPIIEPVVEPEYGFADDVEGVITLSLLVNTEGKVVFDLVVSNDFDEPTTEYLLQQFRSLRFGSPTSKGRPVYAWLSYAVTIRGNDPP